MDMISNVCEGGRGVGIPQCDNASVTLLPTGISSSVFPNSSHENSGLSKHATCSNASVFMQSGSVSSRNMEKILKLSSELQSTKLELAEARGYNAEMLKKNKELTASQSQMQAELDDVRLQYASLSMCYDEMVLYNKQLVCKLTDVEASYRSIQQNIITKHEEDVDLINHTVSEFLSLQSNLEDLEIRLHELQSQHQTLQMDHQDLQSKYLELKSEKFSMLSSSSSDATPDNKPAQIFASGYMDYGYESGYGFDSSLNG